MDDLRKPLQPFSVPIEIMDYLITRYQISHADILGWGARLLYDLSKSEENEWYMLVAKGGFSDNTFQFNTDYRYAAFQMKNLAPDELGNRRIDADDLEQKLKI